LGTFPTEKSGATIHHLLTHTAGLVVGGATLDYSSRKAFVQSVKDTPIESKPGEKYRYTNAGYVLLAAIVEEVSGQPFESYLQKNIFKPAGLNSTGYPWDKKFDNAPVAVGYVGDKLEKLKPTPRETDIWGNRGPGDLITTVGDLYEWTQALRKNKVLSEQAKRKCSPLMFTLTKATAGTLLKLRVTRRGFVAAAEDQTLKVNFNGI
jgi:CubicO group peptidase (beta-lactamase class C family)